MIDGSHFPEQVSGIDLEGGASTVRGLVIDDFFGNGVLLGGAGGDVVAGCYIGVDATGSATAGNGALAGSGVEINGTANNTIGGTTAGDGNVISGNRGFGITLVGAGAGNVIAGNAIGVDSTGSVAVPNNGTESTPPPPPRATRSEAPPWARATGPGPIPSGRTASPSRTAPQAQTAT